MNLNKLFRTFKQKLLLENILKSSLFALMFSAAGVFIVSLIYHILIRETPLKLTLLVGLGIFILSFSIVFIFRYPTKKKVASRIDEIGLQERVSTMLEYRKNETEIASLQRKDAVEQIQKVSAKQMKFRLFKKEFISCAICICMAVTMMFLPYNVLAFGTEDSVSSTEQQQIIKDLIAQLREEVKDSELDDNLKDSLNEVIDQLEEDLRDTESELEQAAKIEQAKKKMEELLEKTLTKKQIGEALQKYELTRALGEAVSAGDSEKVTAALNDLEESISSDTALVSTLSETIVSALEASGVDSSDELYSAFNDFSSALSEVDIKSDSFAESLKASFDTAEVAILAALEKQASIEAEKEKLEDAMSEAKDEILGNEKEESEEKTEGEEGEKPEGEQQDGEKSEGKAPNGEKPEGDAPQGEGQGEGEGDGEGSSMTEGIYDPISGSVSYGEVFAAYYAEYLAALEAGEVPEDLQEIIDQYFSSLN